MEMEEIDPTDFLTITTTPPKKRKIVSGRKGADIGERPFPCSFCRYRAKYKSNLTRHVSSVHLREKRHFCKHCTYAANEKRTLDLHIATIHKDLRPYPCKHCNKTFAQRGNLMTHLANSHNGDKPHECHYCSFRALRIGDLKLHVAQAHLGKKRFYCTLCDFSGCARYDLKCHMQIEHAFSSHFKCDKCCFKTKDISEFKEHCANHRKTLYACFICYFQTSNKKTLRLHILKNHTDEEMVQGHLEIEITEKITDDTDLLQAYGLQSDLFQKESYKLNEQDET